MSTGRRILRNSLYGLASEAIGGALSFLVVILIARSLGVERFGDFSYILAFTAIFQLIADFGLTNILVREIVRAQDQVARVVGAIKPLVWLLSLATFAVIALISLLSATSVEALHATLIMGVAVLVTFHAVIYGSVCRAREEMGFNAVAFVTHKVLLLGLVMLALHEDRGLVGIALAYLLANLYQWGFYYWVVRNRYARCAWRVDVAYWKELIAEAFPIGAAMVFRRATLHVDTLMLTLMSSATSVGLFNAAYRVIQMIDMIPFTLSIPQFPVLSRLAKESAGKFHAALTQAQRLFFIVAVPLCVWLLILAPDIIAILFGDRYSDAALTLRVLSAAVLFLFPTSLYIYVFSALGKQKYYTLSSGLCLAANVLLDVILIPHYGHLGAAVATLAAEATFFVSGAVMLNRLGLGNRFWRLITRPLLAAACAAAILIWPLLSNSALALIAASVAYMVAFLLLALVFKIFNPEELALVRGSISWRGRPWSSSRRLIPSPQGDVQ